MGYDMRTGTLTVWQVPNKKPSAHVSLLLEYGWKRYQKKMAFIQNIAPYSTHIAFV